MWKQTLSAGLLCSLMACSQGSEPAETVVETLGNSAGEPEIDDFALAIESERWSVMIDNAHTLFVDGGGMMDTDERSRANEALRRGALSLAMLRDGVCTAGFVKTETCAAYVVPDWAVSWDGVIPSPQILQARSEWLGEALQPFEAAVCTDGEGGRAIECMVE